MTEANDDTNGRESLFGITCRLTVSLSRCDCAALDSRTEKAHADQHHGGDGKHGERKSPALDEADCEARDAHADGVEDLTVLVANATLDLVALLTDPGRKFHVV